MERVDHGLDFRNDDFFKFMEKNIYYYSLYQVLQFISYIFNELLLCIKYYAEIK